MGDLYSKEKRSEIMSKISSKDTKLEIIVRKHLFSLGFRYRKNDKRLPGKPDIVLPKYKTVIFIHGCYWHGHYCKAAALPLTNREFWGNKIQSNKIRDRKNIKELKKTGWTVITIWQCNLKNIALFKKTMSTTVKKIIRGPL